MISPYIADMVALCDTVRYGNNDNNNNNNKTSYDIIRVTSKVLILIRHYMNIL